MSKEKGFTLIELIVFIVVIGIVVTAILVPLIIVNQQSPNPNYQTVALQLAKERLELILGQRYLNGYVNFADPCTVSTPPAVCTSLTGYTVTATIATITTGKQVVVTVTGLGKAVLTANIGNY